MAEVKEKATAPCIKLPISKKEVELGIATGNDEVKANTACPIKPGDTESYLKNRRALLCSTIKKVDGQAVEFTVEDLNNLPLRDRGVLEISYQNINDVTEADEQTVKESVNPFFGK